MLEDAVCLFSNNPISFTDQNLAELMKMIDIFSMDFISVFQTDEFIIIIDYTDCICYCILRGGMTCPDFVVNQMK